MPLVSVIIPTLNRPQLLMRALRSVFAQTHAEIEVIVVVDGPDQSTISALEGNIDPRLRVLINPKSLTAAGARNRGIDEAKGAWIAFLDDDDEWLPQKLARQIEFAQDRGPAIISCLNRVVTSQYTFIRPAVMFDNSIPLDEYLFDQRSPFGGAGFIQTSGYLAPREVFEQARFRTDNPHDDWDLLLRLSKELGLRIETVPEVLAILYIDDGRPSLSKAGSWLTSLQWIDSVRPMITRRAYGGFCLGVVGPRAAKEWAYGAIPVILYRSFKYGSPRLWRVAAFLAMWLLPLRLFQRLRGMLSST